jgi:hypothetical protein
MTPDDVLAGAIVPGTDGIFFLGCFDRRVTVYTQQVRAFNLVDALPERKLIRAQGGHVAVIGGGVAGVTAATALAIGTPQLRRIDLFETKDKLLHLQLGSRDRFLHPHIYDWPELGSTNPDAGLPLMNWHAAPATEVAARLLRQFHNRHMGKVHVLTSHRVTRVRSLPGVAGGLVKTNMHAKDLDPYDAVILSIGFGYETLLKGENHSYWDASLLASPLRTNEARPVLFISGNGDGGLVDFLMAAFNGWTHEMINQFIVKQVDDENVWLTLLSIDDDAWLNPVSVDIYDQYRRHIKPNLSENLLRDVRDHLRPNAEIWLHTREPHLFRPDTAVLNRFATFLVIEADAVFGRMKIHLSVGKPLLGSPERTDSVVIKGQPPIRPLHRFLRFGPDKRANFAPFRALADIVRAHRAAQLGGTSRPVRQSLTPSAEIRWTAVGSALRVYPIPARKQPTDVDEGKRPVVVSSLYPFFSKEPDELRATLFLACLVHETCTIPGSMVLKDRTYAAILSRSRAGNGVWGLLRMRWRLN